jgi:predicted AAA+ superfamily ATPase
MSDRLTGLVDRRLSSVVVTRMIESPVLVLQGARSVGKSTLLRDVSAAAGREIVDLDDLAVRDAVRADPALFVGSPPPVFIDEFQHVPEILDAIKARLNRDSGPGQFVITGSTRFESLPRAAQSLTGRLQRLTVWPLSQGELAGTRESFAESLVGDPSNLVRHTRSGTTREDYIERIVGGGLPLALAQPSEPARQRWFADYLDLILERDVLELSKIRQRTVLPRLLQRLAGQTAQVLNIANAARAVGMETSTAEDYTRLLESVFLLYRLPAWGRTLRSRAVATPKIHLVDSGLAARLLRLTPAKLASLQPAALTEFGHLFETFCVGEVLKQLSWLDLPTEVGHWRTHDGDEVDLVIERADGAVIAVEVKTEGRASGGALTGMRKLRDTLGDSFLGGVLLYTGPMSITMEDRLHAIPADRLWTR